MNEFAVARRMRILSSNDSLPPSMWLLLVVGPAGTIMFTWFYGTHYLSIQIAATTFLSAVIIYGVLLVAMLEYPFGMKPTAFQELHDVFERRLKAEMAHTRAPGT